MVLWSKSFCCQYIVPCTVRMWCPFFQGNAQALHTCIVCGLFQWTMGCVWVSSTVNSRFHPQNDILGMRCLVLCAFQLLVALNFWYRGCFLPRTRNGLSSHPYNKIKTNHPGFMLSPLCIQRLFCVEVGPSGTKEWRCSRFLASITLVVDSLAMRCTTWC